MRRGFQNFGYLLFSRRERWRVYVAVAGLCLSITAALLTQFLVSGRVDALNQVAVTNRADEVEKNLGVAFARVRAVAALVRTSNSLDRQAFQRFVSQLQDVPSVVAVHWIPEITGELRQSFEAEARDAGWENFQVLDRDAQGRLRPAAARKLHYPVFYTYPMEGNERVVGLDIASSPAGIAALQLARESRHPSASAPFDLVQDPSRATAIALYVPVFSMAEAKGEQHFMGAVSGILRIGSLALVHNGARAQVVAIRDVSAKEPVSLFGPAISEAEPAQYHQDLPVGTRKWRLYIQPDDIPGVGWVAFLVLGIGTLATTLTIASGDRALKQRALEETVGTLEQTERTYFALFENAGTANCEVDARTGRILRVNRRMCELFGYEREELVGMKPEALSSSEEYELHALEWSNLLQADGGVLNIEKRYRRKDGSSLWGLVTARRIQTRSGGRSVLVVVIQDISDRKSAEEARSLLVRELAHRLRNTMQLVTSLADQTAKSAGSVEDYKQAFQGRLRALVTAQDMLFDSGWHSVSLKRLVAKTLAPFRTRDGGLRVGMRIDEVNLTPQQSQTIALAIYELASNSTRHGALSATAGSVDFSITMRPMDNPEDGSILDMEWQESGGPPVREPARKGFGLLMLEQLLVRQHDGQASYDWLDSGVRYRATLPLRSDHLS